jgi:hypothetical protein
LEEKYRAALRYLLEIAREYDAALRGRPTADPREVIERAEAWAKAQLEDLERAR